MLAISLVILSAHAVTTKACEGLRNVEVSEAFPRRYAEQDADALMSRLAEDFKELGRIEGVPRDSI
jgi:hypothetical protein